MVLMQIILMQNGINAKCYYCKMLIIQNDINAKLS
jgi:hypothetical protein